MPRTVKEQDYAVKRNEILDATQRLLMRKGFEQIAIQELLDELQISKGAFYHYFDSKQDLLEGLIERMIELSEQILMPIVHDQNLSALDKLQRYLDTAVQWKTAQKAFITDLVRVWYSDHNARFRQKMWAAMSKRAITPLMDIIHQGIHEGVLHVAFPQEIGQIMLSMIQSFGDGFAALLLSDQPQGDKLPQAERLVAAYNDAFERLLGGPAGSIHFVSSEALHVWFGVPGDALATDGLTAATPLNNG
jgi:AcrR family transcriptional regulator